MPGPCAFCGIVSGDVAADVVAATDDTVAFLDHRPLFAGHTLVVPREHIATLLDLPPELVGPFAAEVQRVTAAVTEILGAQGTFVATNNVVSQSVPHLHTHVVPRTKGDGLRGFFWPRHPYGSDEARRAVAERLRARLARGATGM